MKPLSKSHKKQVRHIYYEYLNMRARRYHPVLIPGYEHAYVKTKRIDAEKNLIFINEKEHSLLQFTFPESWLTDKEWREKARKKLDTEMEEFIIDQLRK